jgi:hypothetical protein
MTTVSFIKVWRRRAAATVYLAVLTLLAIPAVARPPAGQAVLVDRLVAIVGEQALTWRDVEAARLLGSIPATGAAVEAIDRLVTRELMHIEVERLSVAAPIGAAVDERLTRAQQRAGGPEAFARALRTLGLSEAQAREWVADDLRMDVYVDQRFTAAAQPTDVEVAREATRGGRGEPTPDQLREARRSLVQARRTALVADWLAGIRERTPVQIAGTP